MIIKYDMIVYLKQNKCLLQYSKEKIVVFISKSYRNGNFTVNSGLRKKTNST